MTKLIPVEPITVTRVYEGQISPQGPNYLPPQRANITNQIKEALKPSETKPDDPGQEAKKASKQVSDFENLALLREIALLKSIDRKVRLHEQAHLLAGSGLIRGGPHYEYQRGPDGKFYAVAGEVSIDTTPVPNDPEATIRKAKKIIRAALAPANPSAQDLRVAAKARAMLIKAQIEAAKEKGENK